MAKRICFISKPSDQPIFQEILVEFKYYSGFALSQKQKSIKAMHESINHIDKYLKVLEISTKSTNPIGVALSAFNLKFFDEKTGREYPLENVFQSSKVFEYGGPYRDLLNVSPKESKRDERIKTSGKLVNFNWNNTIWELKPKTMFYDWLYIRSLYRNKDLSKKILDYNAFTDIEFNHKVSVNCQARSAAIFVSLSKKGILNEVLNNKNKFKRFYLENDFSQMSLFDF